MFLISFVSFICWCGWVGGQLLMLLHCEVIFVSCWLLCCTEITAAVNGRAGISVDGLWQDAATRSTPYRLSGLTKYLNSTCTYISQIQYIGNMYVQVYSFLKVFWLYQPRKQLCYYIQMYVSESMLLCIDEFVFFLTGCFRHILEYV